MNKTELTVLIDDLLGMAIEAYEVADSQLEDDDHGALERIHISLEHTIECLRRARRLGKTLLEQYEDDLTKKPEYMEQDEDEDED